MATSSEIEHVQNTPPYQCSTDLSIYFIHEYMESYSTSFILVATAPCEGHTQAFSAGYEGIQNEGPVYLITESQDTYT